MGTHGRGKIDRLLLGSVTSVCLRIAGASDGGARRRLARRAGEFRRCGLIRQSVIRLATIIAIREELIDARAPERARRCARCPQVRWSLPMKRSV